METTEIILRENGTLTERVIRERELDAGQSVLDALTDGVTRDVRNVVAIPDWGMVHASVGLSDTIWSVPIDRIPLHARFRLIQGVLVPAFASSSDVEMPLVWHAPKEVRLAFVVRTEFADDCQRISGNWLFACDKDNRGYRLPLPNLHDDCLICTGIFAANEMHSSETYYYRRTWKGTPRDPRVYYPELKTDRSGDPRAASIGCTGEVQENNRQLVSANLMAAALAEHLFVLWNLKAPRMDKETVMLLPHKFAANLSKLETYHWKGAPNE